MMRAHVTTDGSCVNDPRTGACTAGGWAARVENGSDGWMLRGRQANATSTGMEIVAVIEGLRSLPEGIPVAVHSDCTVILSILDRWQRHRLPREGTAGYREGALWRELGAQFDRFTDVEVRLVQRRDHDTVHRRCHLTAQAQAKALARGGHGEELPIPDPPRRPRRDWFIDPDPLRVAQRRTERRRSRAQHGVETMFGEAPRRDVRQAS